MKKLLIIAFVWPEPSSTAAGNRMLQIIEYFKNKSYEITIASTAAITDLSMNFNSLEIQSVAIKLNHESFDVFISELKPDVVLFDRFLTEEQFGWRVAEFAPKAMRILDTEDLHSLRQVRLNCLKKGVPFSAYTWLNAAITKREITSIYRCDLTLVISTYEMFLLSSIVKVNSTLLLYVPFMLDSLSEKEINYWPNFKSRTDFMFIGNGKHAPNIDAIRWLKKEIWPLIKKGQPEASLKIFGAYLPEFIKQMHKPKEGFFIEGWAPSCDLVMQQALVNLAPLRFGAGLKGKLISAMQNGLPTVTTAIGAEGIHLHLPFNGSIANTSENIALAAIQLYTDQKKWNSAQHAGIAIINTLFNKSDWIKKFDSKILFLQNNLESHRTQNFIGAMLMQNTLASSKYMSKWIHEKARNN